MVKDNLETKLKSLENELKQERKKNLVIKKSIKDAYLKNNINQHQRWYNVEEHLPETDRKVICFSEVFREYYIASFHPYSGWAIGDGSPIRNITQWLDVQLFLPFEEGDIDLDLAKKYKLVR